MLGTSSVASSLILLVSIRIFSGWTIFSRSFFPNKPSWNIQIESNETARQAFCVLRNRDAQRLAFRLQLNGNHCGIQITMQMNCWYKICIVCGSQSANILLGAVPLLIDLSISAQIIEIVWHSHCTMPIILNDNENKWHAQSHCLAHLKNSSV